jgi:hypothetical protein
LLFACFGYANYIIVFGKRMWRKVTQELCLGRLQKHLRTSGMLCQVCFCFCRLFPRYLANIKNISPFVLTCSNAAEEKEPYEEMARDDKQRYKSQVNDYKNKNPQPMMVDSGYESDSWIDWSPMF